MVELKLEPGTYEYKYLIINNVIIINITIVSITIIANVIVIISIIILFTIRCLIISIIILFTIRYLINGIWFLDSSKPTAKDLNGHLNNILTVSVVS